MLLLCALAESPILKKKLDKQVNVGKMQIKEVTMATSDGFFPFGTCQTDIFVEKKEDRKVTFTFYLRRTKRQVLG